jgi:hypothetical protein
MRALHRETQTLKPQVGNSIWCWATHWREIRTMPKAMDIIIYNMALRDKRDFKKSLIIYLFFWYWGLTSRLCAC